MSHPFKLEPMPDDARDLLRAEQARPELARDAHARLLARIRSAVLAGAAAAAASAHAGTGTASAEGPTPQNSS